MSNALLHPFSAPGQPEADYIKVVGGEGATVWDDKGRRYLDGLASLWYCQIGYGRADMHAAIAAQMEQLGAYHTFAPFTNDPAAHLAEMIAERSPLPDGRVFLGCSGSEAIDTVLKLARMTHQLRGDHDRQVIIRRTHGYHGTNFGGTSAQGIAPNRENWGDLVPHFIEVPQDDIEPMATAFAQYGERIAAVLTEPVQGAGGVLMPPDGYLEGTRRLCDDNGALLILDEVITGFGRTGSWFGAQTFDIKPDFITFAKGVSSGYLPLSGVIVGRGVADTLEAMDGILRTGYTYSGHPTCAAAGIKNIEIIEQEGLLERANHIGELMSAGLSALAADGVIESYRGIGALWAADLGRDALPARDSLLQDHSVIVRPIGNSIGICPPLVITDDEIATMLDAFADTFARF